MEKCDRCGDVGPDRRTLWMACWYAMYELDVPFKEVQFKGKLMKLDSVTNELMFDGGPMMRVAKFSDDPDAKEHTKRMYTLRVCKGCRADWMRAIETWFKNIDLTGEDGVAGVYIRDKGTNRLMTQEEIDRRFPNDKA